VGGSVSADSFNPFTRLVVDYTIFRNNNMDSPMTHVLADNTSEGQGLIV